MKVYCRYCTFFLDCNKACTHPSNQYIKEEHTWYDKTKVWGYKKNPSVLNANNDCKNYTDKAQMLRELNK